MCISYKDTKRKNVKLLYWLSKCYSYWLTGSVVISTFNDTTTNDKTLTYSQEKKVFLYSFIM